jgi:hypothetical protein
MSHFNTTTQTGFARSASEAMFPRLFPDAGWWCPSLNPAMGGTRLWDLSGRQNWGTLTNMDPATDWVVSGGKGALDLDGSDDVVTARALQPRFPLSVFWWAKYRSVTNQNAVVQFTTASGIDYVFHVFSFTSDSRTYFFTDSVNAGNNVSIATSARPSIADWLQIGIVFSSSTSVALYWNGSLLTATNITGVGSITPTGINLGRRTGAATGSVDGQLDDLRIYNRALTAGEVSQLWQIGRGNMPLRRRRRYAGQAAGGFKGYWARNNSRLIGAGNVS